MSENTLKSQSILPRIDGIQKDLVRLERLSKLSESEFAEETNFILSQFFLREALEGVFHIGSHILSRLPGGRTTQYKEIALKLGEFGVVDKKFAETSLKDMAGYRNRLTHFYADITPVEIQRILKENLKDFSTFLVSVKAILENPAKLNLTLE